MVSRQEDVRDRHPLILPRLGVLGVFEEPVLEGFFLRAGAPQSAGQQPHDGVDDRHRRQFAAGQDVVAHGDLFIDAAEDAGIHALVVAAEKDEVREFRESPRGLLIVRLPGRGHGNAPYIARGVLFLHVPQRVEHRLAAHHHARSPAEGRVVDVAETALRELLDVDDVDGDEALVDGAGHDRGLQKALEAFREDGQNGDLHGLTPFLCGSAFYLIGRPHRMQEKLPTLCRAGSCFLSVR